MPGLIGPRPEPIPPAAIRSYCEIAKPIFYDSSADSPETIKQIEEHNSKWVCVCEGDCPKQPD